MRWNIKHVRPICKWVSLLPTSVLLSHRGAFWRHDRDLHSEASIEAKGGLLAELCSSWVHFLLVHVQGPSTDAITAPWIHGLGNRVAGDVVERLSVSPDPLGSGAKLGALLALLPMLVCAAAAVADEIQAWRARPPCWGAAGVVPTWGRECAPVPSSTLPWWLREEQEA